MARPNGSPYMGTPPANCDLCGEDITDKFYDAHVPRYGQWGNVCPGCFASERCATGTGAGQEYTKNADGKFIKTAG